MSTSTSGRQAAHVVADRTDPLKEKDGDGHHMDTHEEDKDPRQKVKRL